MFFHNSYGPLFAIGNVGVDLAKETLGILGALEFVGIMGASVSENPSVI